jgi:putative transposase
MSTTVVQAYRFALDPTPGQVAALVSHCGGQRFAYNWGLARVKANLGQRDAERSYGVPTEELTPSLSWSAYALRKEFNRAKDEIAPWCTANSKEAYASGLANLATALGHWNSSRSGQRTGRKVRFPRFKGKRHTRSVRFTTGAFGLAEGDRRHVRLPRIGTVRTHESTRKLARHLERGDARVRSATVSYRSGRWQVSLSVEIDRAQPAPATIGGTVGVDLGVKSLAVLSTGDTIANPKHLQAAHTVLRRLQRQGACRIGLDTRTGRKPSARWHATQARIRRLHAAIAQARADGLHKLTTRLTGMFDTIVIEDLNVSGMLANRALARHVADVGMAELRRQVEYKTTWYGRTLIVADRWYPSSKTCSACGVVKAKLRLSERPFTCDTCGVTLDRDYNAARNLAALADGHAGSTSTASCAATVNEPAGNPHKTSPAGTGYRHGKTHHPVRPTLRSNIQLRKPCTVLHTF